MTGTALGNEVPHRIWINSGRDSKECIGLAYYYFSISFTQRATAWVCCFCCSDSHQLTKDMQNTQNSIANVVNVFWMNNHNSVGGKNLRTFEFSANTLIRRSEKLSTTNKCSTIKLRVSRSRSTFRAWIVEKWKPKLKSYRKEGDAFYFDILHVYRLRTKWTKKSGKNRIAKIASITLEHILHKQ